MMASRMFIELAKTQWRMTGAGTVRVISCGKSEKDTKVDFSHLNGKFSCTSLRLFVAIQSRLMFFA